MAKHVKIAGRSFSIPESSDLGEDNTTSNEGGGVGLAMPKSGLNLPFKSLKAGENVTITYDTDSVTIASTGGGGGGGTGDITGAENIGSAGYSIFAGEVDGVLQFKKLSLGSYGLNLQTMVGGELVLSTLYPDMGVNLGIGGAEIYSHIEPFGNRMGICFRQLRAGSNITLTQFDDHITIDAASGGEGEANTSSNVGGAVGLAKAKVGVNLPFKTLVPGRHITLTSATDTVTIASTDTGEANTASNLGVTGESLFAQKSGVDLKFKKLKAGSNVTLTSDAESVTISSTDTDTGEVNTASNQGAGTGLVMAKNGVDLPFKTLKAGTNVAITSDSNSVTISSTDTGETNTASNLGATGEGVFAQKSGADLQFKKLKAGSNVSITSDSESVTISSTDTGEANTASNQGSGEGLVMAKSGVDLPFKTIKAGTNITLSATSNELTINSSGGSSDAPLAPFRNKVVNGDFSAFKNTAYQDVADSGKITARWELSRSPVAGAAHLEESGGMIFGKPRFDVGTKLTIYNDTTYSPVAADASAVIRTPIDAVGVMELFDTPITLSFYIMSNIVGTYCVSLTANPNQLRYVAEVAVTTANTWEYKTITIPAGIPYSGYEQYFEYPNTQPWLFVNFALYVGANCQTATTNAWTTGETGYLATANQVNFADSLDNYLEIAAVQLEKGAATLFDNTSQTLMVETCTRTYNQWSANSPNHIYPFSGRASSATSVDIAVTLPSPQLITEPAYVGCDIAGLVLTNGTSDYTISNIVINKLFNNYVTLTVTSSGMTVGDTITFKSANYGCNLRVYATDW